MKKLLHIFFVALWIVQTLVADDGSAVRAGHCMVVAADPLAAEAGLEILRNGGNAIDAAVAVGFVLAVTYPGAGNIGGGGFMVISMKDGRAASIDYREKAPAAASSTMYLDADGRFLPEKSTIGHLAAGVPGSVAGMLLALEKFGTLTRAQVIGHAVSLAQKGFPLHPRLAAALREMIPEFRKFPSSLETFTKNGAPYAAGEIFRQLELAATLQRIIDRGEAGFYTGTTADRIVAEMKRGGGLITHTDLKSYEAKLREPLHGTYRGYEILSIAPPSSGGVALLQMLYILEAYDVRSMGWNSARTIHLLTETMRRVYADRAEYLGDPDFVNIPLSFLLSKQYAAQRRMTIDLTSATPSSRISYGRPVKQEPSQTTHYSIVDAEGNCVSVTTTLNGGFGSGVVVSGAGFLLNNEMDDFSAKPGTPNMYGLIGSSANAIQPGKRMLSSMTPTIILKNSMPFMVIGTPGGSTIMTTVLQVVCNVIDFRMDIRQAIDVPRFHHQWQPDILYYEDGAFTDETRSMLRSMKHAVEKRKGSSGLAEGILIDTVSHTITGWSDSRGYGKAVGY